MAERGRQTPQGAVVTGAAREGGLVAVLARGDADAIRAAMDETGRIRLRLEDRDADVSGHASSGDDSTVRLTVDGDDDTEGHAIALRLPTARDADELRRRLLLAGVLTATVTLGAVGVVTEFGELAAGEGTTVELRDVSYEDTTPNSDRA